MARKKKKKKSLQAQRATGVTELNPFTAEGGESQEDVQGITSIC